MPNNSFLQDYMAWNSGDECPKEYHLWSGITLLGALLGRKIWMWHGEEYFQIHGHLFTCLVGKSNSGKSTAKGRPQKIIYELFPEYPVSANLQSREDIAEQMALQENTIFWKDKDGHDQEYHPFFLIVNEMANFFSTSERKMVDFLTDIYDQDHFTTGFKSAKAQRKMPNPYVSMLACTTPGWFMANFKGDLFEGGLGRRLIIVSRERTQIIAEPRPPTGASDNKKRFIEHLRRVSYIKTFGEVIRTPEAKKYWASVYTEIRKTTAESAIMDVIIQAKANHLLKLALIMAFDRYDYDFQCTEKDFYDAKMLLDTLTEDFKSVSAMSGENPMAPVAAQMVDHIRIAGGVIQEVRLKAVFYPSCPRGSLDYNDALNHLLKVGELVLIKTDMGKGDKQYLFLPEKYEEFQKTTGPKVPGFSPVP